MDKKIIHVMDDFRSVKLLICSLALLICLVRASSDPVPITYLESAKEKGAVCLNGNSPPAYYYDKGYGEGASKWIIYLEGGGWCTSDGECHDDIKRYKTTWECNIGGCSNSYLRNKTTNFVGILSGSQIVNPDFYNWNRVYVIYCDVGLFSGDVEEVDPAKKIYRRGARIFKAVVDDLQDKGLKTANNAILAGSSAGGLATVLNCDNFRSLVPNVEKVKCIADSGFFIHAKALGGAEFMREKQFNDLAAYHGIEKILPTTCTSKMSPGLCLFPENLVGDIKTPLFIVDSLFDSFQLTSQMPFLGSNWIHCVTGDLQVCLSNQTLVQPVKDFRVEFLKALPKCGSIGMFIDTCTVHTHFTEDNIWTRYTVNNKTLGGAVGDWYFDRSNICEIDTTNEFLHKCNVNY